MEKSRDKGEPKLKAEQFEVDTGSLLDSVGALLQQIADMSGVKIAVLLDPKPFIALICLFSIFLAYICVHAGTKSAQIYYTNFNANRFNIQSHLY